MVYRNNMPIYNDHLCWVYYIATCFGHTSIIRKNILIARVSQLTTDPLFYNIANSIVIVLYIQLLNIVFVMGDVIASVYTFHSPLSSKVDLSAQRGSDAYFINFSLLMCWFSATVSV
jgi:hypothetical protein